MPTTKNFDLPTTTVLSQSELGRIVALLVSRRQILELRPKGRDRVYIRVGDGKRVDVSETFDVGAIADAIERLSDELTEDE